MRNPYKHIDSEPIIATQHGNPSLFVGKVDTIENLNNTIASLKSFSLSVVDQNGSNQVTDISHIADYSSVKIIQSEINANRQELLSKAFVANNNALRGLATNIDEHTPIVKGGVIKYAKHTHKK